MNARTLKTTIPGEIPPGTNEGETHGVRQEVAQPFPADQKSGVEVPAGLSYDQLVATVAILQAQQLETQRLMAGMVASGANLPTAAPNKPITMAEAKKRGDDLINRGEVPTSVLTDEGFYVHPLSYTTPDKVVEHTDKVLANEAKKKLRQSAAH